MQYKYFESENERDDFIRSLEWSKVVDYWIEYDPFGCGHYYVLYKLN